MKLFGLLVIVILFTIFLSGKNIKGIYLKLLAFTICLEAYFDVGYFIRIGSYEFSYLEFVLSVLAIFSLVVIITKPMNPNLVMFGFLLIFVITLSNSFLLIAPLQKLIITYGIPWTSQGEIPSFNIQTVKMSLRIIIIILVSMAAVSLVKKEEIEYLKNVFVKYGILFLAVGAVEFVAKNLFRSNIINTLIGLIFGTGESTVTFLLQRDDVFSLQGITREPAHFSYALFSFCLVLLFSKTKIKHFNFLFFTSIAEMMLSRSLGGVLLIVGLLAIYCIVKNKMLIGILLISCLSPFVIMSKYFIYYINRWMNVLSFFNNFHQNFAVSEQFRLYSVYVNFKLLPDRPILGLGVGTSYAYGFLPTIIANIGILGFISWLLFMFTGIARMKLTLKNTLVVLILLFLWILTGSLATMYSMPLLLAMLMLRNTTLNSEFSENPQQIKKNGKLVARTN